MDVAGRHLAQAIHLATDNDLPEIAYQSQFVLGTLSAEKGDLPQPLQAYQQAISLTHATGDHYIEMLGHNNLAYHAHLTDYGSLVLAHLV